MLSLALTSCLAVHAENKNQNTDKPNVIFIYADDLGYGDLECYGAKNVQTPNVNRLASEGIRFINAHATAATSTPSRYSMLTGEYAWRKPGTDVAAGNAGMIIRPEQYTMADMFKSSGYATGAFGKWHLGLGDKTAQQDWNAPLSASLGDLGFDYSYIMAATADRVPCVFIENGQVANYDPSAPIEVSYIKNFPGEPTGKDNPELLYNLKPSHGHDMSIVNGISRIGYMKGGGKALWKDENIADSITAHAVDFIKQHKDEPFFMYFATNDVHVPRFPHNRFRGKNKMGLRGDAIAQFDWSVGQLLEALDKMGLTQNTLIILSSDNGPVVDDGYDDKVTEYERYLIDKHIAYHTARGSGDATHDNGHPERIAQRQALAHAHHRKQCQTDGVEYKECIVQMDKVLSEEDNPQQCQSGTYQINGVGHPAGSHIQQQVAYRTAADGGYETHDVSTEPVETFRRSQPYAADGESKCTDKVEYLNKCWHESISFFAK